RVCSERMTSSQYLANQYRRNHLESTKTRKRPKGFVISCFRGRLQPVPIQRGRSSSSLAASINGIVVLRFEGGGRSTGLANRRPHAARAPIGKARKGRSVLRPIVGGGFRRLHDIAAARSFQDFLSFLRPGFVVAMYRNQVSAFPDPPR